MSSRADRREFLGAIVTASGSVLGSQSPQGSLARTSPVTPADSLWLYLELLRLVQIEVAAPRADQWSKATAAVTQALESLASTVEKLEKVLATAKHPDAAQAQLLADTGKAVVDLVRDGAHGPFVAAEAYVSAVARFAEASAAGQESIVLTGEAVTLFRSLLAQVKTVQQLQLRAQAASTTYEETVSTIAARMERARDLILDAAGQVPVAAGDRAAPGISPAGESALRDAIAIVRESARESQTAGVLAELLDGARLWMRQQAAPAGLAAFGYQPAGFRSQPAAQDTDTRLIDLLRRYCPLATRVRAFILLALVGPVWTLHADPVQRRRLLRVVLDLFPCQGRNSHQAEFIDALATFGTNG